MFKKIVDWFKGYRTVKVKYSPENGYIVSGKYLTPEQKAEILKHLHFVVCEGEDETTEIS